MCPFFPSHIAHHSPGFFEYSLMVTLLCCNLEQELKLSRLLVHKVVRLPLFCS
jgi:hypothetical protein